MTQSLCEFMTGTEITNVLVEAQTPLIRGNLGDDAHGDILESLGPEDLQLQIII